ncbi:MAG: hypothetical protein AAF702_24975 [Chloroflexota bacterium]
MNYELMHQHDNRTKWIVEEYRRTQEDRADIQRLLRKGIHRLGTIMIRIGKSLQVDLQTPQTATQG